MSDEERLFADVARVAAEAKRDQESRELLNLIEMVKASVIMNFGSYLADIITSQVLLRPEVARRLSNASEIVVQVARCFEIIAQREWLGREQENKEP